MQTQGHLERTDSRETYFPATHSQNLDNRQRARFRRSESWVSAGQQN